VLPQQLGQSITFGGFLQALVQDPTTQVSLKLLGNPGTTEPVAWFVSPPDPSSKCRNLTAPGTPVRRQRGIRKENVRD